MHDMTLYIVINMHIVHSCMCVFMCVCEFVCVHAWVWAFVVHVGPVGVRVGAY